MTYTGPERRGDEPGRRRPDDFMRYCPEHEMRVELANERHGQAAKRDEHICQKVTSLDSKIDKRVTHLEGILEKLRGHLGKTARGNRGSVDVLGGDRYDKCKHRHGTFPAALGVQGNFDHFAPG